jgi:hypothetical protein
MGAVSFSIDRDLVQAIQDVVHANVFVETGTFEGDTVARIEDLFDTVWSVESSPEYYDAASRRFHDRKNIHVALGDSPRFLTDVRDDIGTSAIFWLDAHWCVAASTSGEQSQCPLLAELEAIGTLGEGSVILIDDARLFVAAPPKPHEVSHWPTFSQVLQRLARLSAEHMLMIVNDVIIFYPPALDEPLRAYAHETSIDWLHVLDKSREYDVMHKALLEKDAALHRALAASEEFRLALIAKDDALQEIIRSHETS